jgi:glutaminase
LVGQGLPLYKKFEYVKKFWEGLAGGGTVGFQNATYLSEKDTASRNFCLGHMMMNSKAFPKGTNLEETLEFYFQLCSLEIKSKDMAVVAATLANGGVCPLTNQRIFKEETVNHVLSIMHSCGMYDYSGEWGYSVGIPAKSGVGGCVYLVVPKVMGICVFCPRLDERGNSVRGIEVSKLLLKEFTMHRYDLLKGVVTPFSYKKSLLQSLAEQENSFRIDVLNAIDFDDLYQLQSLIEMVKESNFDINSIKDYDGVTPAHLCCSAGHEEILLYLIKLDADFLNVQDKWGTTPIERARRAGKENITALLDRIYSLDTEPDIE